MNVVINLDKPKGLTSQEAVTRLKKVLGTKKAGHAGTLDPLATGILLVCVGEATKITRFLADLDKEYVARMKLGERTDTLDSEGRVVRRVEGFRIEKEDAEETIKRFEGPILQRPPMYSAIKVNGKPLYKLARKGIEVERAERPVTIRRIEMTEFDPPWIELKVLCSKGTYVRTLSDDIGEALGVGAHVVSLRRTRIGSFDVAASVTIEELEDLVQSTLFRVLGENDAAFKVSEGSLRGISIIDEALAHLDVLVLTDAEFVKAGNGLSFRRPEPGLKKDGFVRLKDPEGKLFGIGKASGCTIKIERILHVRS